MSRLPYIDLNQLVILDQLIRTKNVTHTSHNLGISQPAVSRALSRLRDQLKDRLLVRTHGGMQLTPRAQDLAAPLQNWLEHTALLLTPPRFEPQSLIRQFRIASTDFGVSSVIAPALPVIRAAAPGVELDIRPFSKDMIARLGTGDMDMIISDQAHDIPLTHQCPLFTESFLCLFAKDHPLSAHAPDRPLSPDEFLAWPHVSLADCNAGIDHDQVHASLKDRAHERKIIARLSYVQAAPQLLANSDAIMTMPSRAARAFCKANDFACLPVPFIEPIEYRILWHDRSHRDPAIRWIGQILVDQCAARDGASPPPSPGTLTAQV